LDEIGDILIVFWSKCRSDFENADSHLLFVFCKFPVSSLRGIVKYMKAIADFLHQPSESGLDLSELF